MLLRIPQLLNADELAETRRVLAGAPWADGRITAGPQSAQVKRNMQVPEDSAEAKALGQVVLRALGRNPTFASAALPLRIWPPLFNRYEDGMTFGAHVDNAVRGRSAMIRTDVSATLFLADPQSYDGGELVIDGAFGCQRVKLPAGDLVLYPSSSLHRVEPVTRGSRLASFFWVQSMVRDDAQRTLLYDLDTSIGELRSRPGGEDAEAVRLTGVYHNLLRMWAEL